MTHCDERRARHASRRDRHRGDGSRDEQPVSVDRTGARRSRSRRGQAVLDAIRSDGPVTALDERDAVAIEFTRRIFREERVRQREVRRPWSFSRSRHGRDGCAERRYLYGDDGV